MIFYLENCPYCRKAKDALKDLKNDNPAYEKVNIKLSNIFNYY